MHLLSVSQLNAFLRELLEADELLSDIWVEGEISNFTQQRSGHCYFTLKEGEAQLSATLWRSYAARLPFLPRNGDAVLAHGRISFYEARGQLQLSVDSIQAAGVGTLQAQFERLRAKLEAEGLFEESRKRALPSMPGRIGIATSPTGAALQDILNVLGRRFPLAEVVVAPCRVQGAGSADSVVEALYALFDADVNVIIVARGGGSIEDLWSFNEEVVVRAAFASPVPIVSGVGHEVDITLIDLVADVRAPTPSAAAELVTPDRMDLIDELKRWRVALDSAMVERLEIELASLHGLRARLEARSPQSRMLRDMQQVDDLWQRAETGLRHRIDLEAARVEGLTARLQSLNPRSILERGYALVRRSDGLLVTSTAAVQPGDALTITVRDGEVGVVVSSQ